MVKKLFVRLVVLLLLVVATPSTVQAQYVVQPGDTGWALAGVYYDNPAEWRRIVGMNPMLKEPGRVFERFSPVTGAREIILILHPGEVLEGLEHLDVSAPKAVPIDQLKLAQDPPIVETEAVVETVVPGWAWLLMIILLVLVYILWDAYRNRTRHNRQMATQMRQLDQSRDSATERLLEERRLAQETQERERRLNRNPVTSGLPFVEGGITNDTAPEAIQAQAARMYNDLTGRTAAPTMFDIVSITPGRGWGVLEVRYNEGQGRWEMRRLNGERIYQALVRFPDGVVEPLYTLMGCGNDIRFGERRYTPGDDFRFEADGPVVVPAPVVDTPAVATVEEDQFRVLVADVPPAAPVAEVVVEDEPDVVRFEIKPPTAGMPTMIHITGVDMSAGLGGEIRGESVKLRFTPRNKQ